MDKLIKKVTDELDRAKAKHPDWPLDAIYQASVVAEEAGELTRAANQYVCEGGSLEALEEEVVQTAAMCLRMLEAIRGGKTLEAEGGVRIYYKKLPAVVFDNIHTVWSPKEINVKAAEKLFKKYNPECEIISGLDYKLKL